MKLKPYKDENGLWRIDGVHICSTGIEYSLATGKKTFTEDMLKDAINAVEQDVAIKTPRIKLGHSSEYNEVLMADAEPAFGRVENLVLGDNDQSIYGDYVGLPEWLAGVVPIAYPSRSIEGLGDIETVTGKQHQLVITAVSLLGVCWPGCSVIEDLPLWYGSEIPEGVIIDTAEIAAAGGGMKASNMREFAAAVDVSLIRRKFYNDGPGAENWQWWIRGERFDSSAGYNLIVDMGDGNLCRIPVEVDGSNVNFGDEVIVTEEYPDKAMAASAVLAGMAMSDRDMVIYASRADSPDIPSREGVSMNEETRKKLTAKLGLPEDATEAQINAKAAEVLLAESGTGGDGGETGNDPSPHEPEGTPAGDDPTKHEPGTPDEPEETPDEPVVEAGVVSLDAATYSRLKAGADAALDMAAQAKERAIQDEVKAALDDGRIPRSRKDHWTRMLTADFEGGKSLLASLEPGLIPVSERGSAGGDNEGVGSGQTYDGGFPTDWFPEIPALRAKAAVPSVVTQAKEG